MDNTNIALLLNFTLPLCLYFFFRNRKDFSRLQAGGKPIALLDYDTNTAS